MAAATAVSSQPFGFRSCSGSSGCLGEHLYSHDLDVELSYEYLNYTLTTNTPTTATWSCRMSTLTGEPLVTLSSGLKETPLAGLCPNHIMIVILQVSDTQSRQNSESARQTQHTVITLIINDEFRISRGSPAGVLLVRLHNNTASIHATRGDPRPQLNSTSSISPIHILCIQFFARKKKRKHIGYYWITRALCRIPAGI
jgi:hypothetical protein